MYRVNFKLNVFFKYFDKKDKFVFGYYIDIFI